MSHYSPFRSFSEHEGTCCTVGNARRKTLATSPGSLASSFAPSSLCYVVVLVDVHPVLLYSFSHSSTLMYRLSIFFQFPTPKDRTYTQEYKTIRRVRDVHTPTEPRFRRMSRAHRAQPSKDLILPFFFFSIITFASPSRTTFQERQTHGIPYFFNRYTFVSETSSVTNRCITLSLYPSLTSGPCVQFILLHRTEYSVSFSLTSLVMFCFSSICTISSALDRLDV